MRLRWAAAAIVAGCIIVALGIWRNPSPSASPTTSPSPSPKPAAGPSTKPSATPEPILQLPGEIPASGPGEFTGATSGGDVLGSAGRVRRFRVEVEANLTSELDGFTAAIDRALGDPRSWIASGQHRFQRVPVTAPTDFTIYLVTRDTAHRMCGVNGVDIRVDGVPYTSCRQTRKVIINLDRWRRSVPPYVDAGIPLDEYRTYVINHEVGHELGRGHEGCPAPGAPAPVMLTQTLGLQGCSINPWPYPTA